MYIEVDITKEQIISAVRKLPSEEVVKLIIEIDESLQCCDVTKPLLDHFKTFESECNE